MTQTAPRNIRCGKPLSRFGTARYQQSKVKYFTYVVVFNGQITVYNLFPLTYPNERKKAQKLC